MNTKKTISVLKEVDLTEIEGKLLDVNIKLISSKIISVKKCGIDGISRLGNQVYFRIGYFNFINKFLNKKLIR